MTQGRSPSGHLIAMFFFAALGAALASALISIFSLSGCETFFHLAAGREAALSGRIVSEGFFSVSGQGAALQGSGGWLGRLVLYHIHGAFGAEGLVVFRAALGGMAGLILYLAARGCGAGFWVSGGIALGAMVIGLHSGWGVGPELFGYVFIAALQYLVIGYLEGWIGFRKLYIIPPLMLGLDALDGGFWGAVYLCASIFALGVSVPAQRSLRGEALKRLRALGMLVIASAALIALHPHGLRAGFAGWASSPTDVLKGSYAYWVLAGAFALGLLYLRGRARVHGAFVALVFLALAPFVDGGVAVAAIVAVPLIAEASAMLVASGGFGRLRRPLVACCLAAAMAGLGYMKLSPSSKLRLSLGADKGSVPLAAMRFIQDIQGGFGIKGNIHHPPEFGGCVAFYLYPDMRVMDAEANAGILRDEPALERDGITLALLRHGSGLGAETWQPVYRDAASELYLRRVRSNKEAIARLGLEHILPGTKPARILEEATARPHLARSLAREAAQLLEHSRDDALADALARLLFTQGFPPEEGVRLSEAALRANHGHIMLKAAWGLHLYQGGGSRERAGPAMRAGLRLEPELAALALGLAYLDYDSGRYEEAFGEFDRLAGSGGIEARRALYGRALSLMKIGREQEGRRDMERYLRAQ